MLNVEYAALDSSVFLREDITDNESVRSVLALVATEDDDISETSVDFDL